MAITEHVPMVLRMVAMLMPAAQFVAFVFRLRSSINH
jgi:hypothetical protein